MIEINIDGLDELIEKYRRINVDYDADLQNALYKAGQQIQASAKLLCPVDTGELRNSITVEKTDGGISVGTNCEYAVHQEFGTGTKGNPSVAHTTKRKWTYYSGGRFYTTSGNYPQPFLHPALIQNKDRVRQIIANALGGV